jgi:hypothetical protein
MSGSEFLVCSPERVGNASKGPASISFSRLCTFVARQRLGSTYLQYSSDSRTFHQPLTIPECASLPSTIFMRTSPRLRRCSGRSVRRKWTASSSRRCSSRPPAACSHSVSPRARYSRAVHPRQRRPRGARADVRRRDRLVSHSAPESWREPVRWTAQATCTPNISGY